MFTLHSGVLALLCPCNASLADVLRFADEISTIALLAGMNTSSTLRVECNSPGFRVNKKTPFFPFLFRHHGH